MSRKHVVIGGDDAQIGNPVAGKEILVGGGTDRKAVCKIAAGKHRAMHALGNL